jgi:hypothetical protein
MTFRCQWCSSAAVAPHVSVRTLILALAQFELQKVPISLSPRDCGSATSPFGFSKKSLMSQYSAQTP